jgi:hypothetical protein
MDLSEAPLFLSRYEQHSQTLRPALVSSAALLRSFHPKETSWGFLKQSGAFGFFPDWRRLELTGREEGRRKKKEIFFFEIFKLRIVCSTRVLSKGHA